MIELMHYTGRLFSMGVDTEKSYVGGQAMKTSGGVLVPCEANTDFPIAISLRCTDRDKKSFQSAQGLILFLGSALYCKLMSGEDPEYEGITDDYPYLTDGITWAEMDGLYIDPTTGKWTNDSTGTNGICYGRVIEPHVADTHPYMIVMFTVGL